jgi:hypothetical protein
MSPTAAASRVLLVVGLASALVGTIDPLEGSLFILVGIGLMAVGAYIGRSRYRVLLSWSLGLVAVGVAAMVVLSWLGGIGGNSGHSIWLAILIVPYPVGWLLGLVGAILALMESWRHQSPRQQVVH